LIPGTARRIAERILFPRIRTDSGSLRKALCDRTILVTGASFGIGEALVDLLAPSGARLLLVARTADKLREVCRRAQGQGAKAMAIAADLRSESGMESVLAWLDAAPAAPDVVVHNAGKSIHRTLVDSRDRAHDFQRTMAINFFAPVRLTLHLQKSLRERRGQVVGVSAANVLLPAMGGWAAYQSSKTAFDQWMACARQEWEPEGVRFSMVYLPLVRTRMLASNPLHTHAPAMDASQAATRIARLLVRGHGDWSPWWLPSASRIARILPRSWWRRLG